MVTVRIRENEACRPDQFLLWDSVWVQRLDASGGYCDWVLATDGDPAEARGGLRSSAALNTAVLISLFTDRRLPPDMASPYGDDDPRGWWGDSIKFDDEPEQPMGSLLWTLTRGTLGDDTARLAVDYCLDALQPIVDQGAVSRFDVTATPDVARGWLVIGVKGYSQAGDARFDQRFEVLWQQAQLNPKMNYGA